jgi:hypothetical protein
MHLWLVMIPSLHPDDSEAAMTDRHVDADFLTAFCYQNFNSERNSSGVQHSPHGTMGSELYDQRHYFSSGA